MEKTEPATALITIKPEENKAVIDLHKQALRLEHYAKALVITSDDDVKTSTNDLSIIAGLKKAIEEKRKEYTQPINDHLKAINEAFKAFTEPLNQADQITRHKIIDYRAEQERIRQEQEEINRLRIEAANKEMALKGELTESVELVEVQAEPAKHYRAEAGTLGTATIWKFEVIDFSLLPDEYKLPDATKIGKVVRAGLRSIPGVRIYSEELLKVTTNK